MTRTGYFPFACVLLSSILFLYHFSYQDKIYLMIRMNHFVFITVWWLCEQETWGNYTRKYIYIFFLQSSIHLQSIQCYGGYKCCKAFKNITIFQCRTRYDHHRAKNLLFKQLKQELLTRDNNPPCVKSSFRLWPRNKLIWVKQESRLFSLHL